MEMVMKTLFTPWVEMFAKENHTRQARLRHNSADPAVLSIKDVMPELGSVHNVRLGQNGYEKASLSFDGSQILPK